MNKFFGHLHTINKHRSLVRKHCFKCGLYFQGLTHDLSKYSPVEFFNGVKYYQGFRSPTMLERETIGYSKAWLHHRGRNKHHPEYWTDILEDGKYGPVLMPIKYLKESLCDRIAASKIYLKKEYNNSSALNYLLNSEKHLIMHPKSYNILKSWLELISIEGEKKAFKKIKKVKSY